MANEMPRRLAERRRVSEKLPGSLAGAYRILRGDREDAQAMAPPACESVTINVWTNAEGRPCLEIVGNRDLSVLETKGLLHDALWAIAHAEENAPIASS
jgi:hypothetical protein